MRDTSMLRIGSRGLPVVLSAALSACGVVPHTYDYVAKLNPPRVPCEEAQNLVIGTCENTQQACTSDADCDGGECLPGPDQGLPMCLAESAGSALSFGPKGDGVVRADIIRKPIPEMALKVELHDVRDANDVPLDGTLDTRITIRPSLRVDTDADGVPDTWATIPDLSIPFRISLEQGTGRLEVEVGHYLQKSGLPFQRHGPGFLEIVAVDVIDPEGLVFATTRPVASRVQRCRTTWNCTLTQSDLGMVWSYCWYTCIFASDRPAGCSGNAPGVTVGGHEDWFFSSTCPGTLTVTK